MADQHDLSERELEILKLVATGASNKEIAKKLYISPNTVKVHLKNIFGKIGVISRTEAAMFAVRYGLVESDSISTVQDNNLEGESNRDISITENTSSRRIYWLLGLSFILFLIGVGLVFASRSGFVTKVNIPLPTPTEIPRWQRRADMPTARFGLAAAVFDNKIYAIGGETETGVTGVVERYDPATDTWDKLADKPTPVADVGAVVIGGKIFVPGGRLEDGKPTDVLEVFDPLTNLWEEGEKLPIEVSAYAIAAFEGKFIVFGGWNGSNCLSSVIEYEPVRNIWINRSDMPKNRAFSGSANIGEKIYVVGGFDGKNVLTTIDVYIPDREQEDKSSWGDPSTIPSGRYAMGVVGLLDKIYIYGGKGILSGPSMLIFSPYEGKFTTFQIPFSDQRSNVGFVSVGSYIYIFGGVDRSVITSRNIRFQALFTISIPIIQ